MLRHHHALEHERGGGQARHVEDGVGAFERLLGPAAGEEQLAVERGLVDVGSAAVDEELLDARQGLEGFLAAGPGIGRDLAPARDLEALARKLCGEDCPGGGSLGRVGVQEDIARREAWRELDAGVPGNRAQEAFRLLDEKAAAVPRLAIGGDRAAVREALEGSNGGPDQPVAWLIVETGDQPEAAAVAFVAVPVKPAVGCGHGHGPCVDEGRGGHAAPTPQATGLQR